MLEIINEIKKDKRLFDDKVKSYILSFRDEPELFFKCFKLLLMTDYSVEKVKVLMGLKNLDNVSILLDILSNPIFYKNREHIYNELIKASDEDELLEAYLSILSNEKNNLDADFISNVLSMEDSIKAVLFINSSDFSLFESEFRNLINNGVNKILSVEYRKLVVKKLQVLEVLRKSSLNISKFEYREKSSFHPSLIMNKFELSSFIQSCMEDDKYRTNYKRLFIMSFFKSFKEYNFVEFKGCLEKYDLSYMPGLIRYNVFLKYEKQMQRLNN